MEFKTGPIVGIAAAIDAYQPSLMPTPTIDQGIVAGASLFTAGLTAHAIDRGIERSARFLGINPYIVRGAAAAVGIATAAALRARQGESLGRAALRTAGVVTAGASITGGALALSNDATPRVAARLPGGKVVVPAVGVAKLAAGAALLMRSRLKRFEADGRTMPEPESLVKSVAVAAALGGGAAAFVTGERFLVRGAAGKASRTIGAPSLAWKSGGHGVAVGLLAATIAIGVRAMIGKIEAGNNKTESGYADPPPRSNSTSGPGSSVPFETLGHQGRRFVTEVGTAEHIGEVTQEDVRADPVRVYIGYLSADSLEARIELAMEEIRRTEALERSLVIVSSPAGTGYVNYISVEAAEYMGRGDVASVAVQYGRRPSLMSADRITPGAHHLRALLQAIRDECTRTGLSPRIVLYGESLGAHTSQDAFLHQGTDGLERLGVDRALWVGTPYRSEWKEQVFRDDRPDVDRSSFGVFNSIEDVRALSAEDRDRLRIFFLNHYNDPVTKFGIDLSVQEPAWLGPVTDRPPTVSHTQRWSPLVTFWQTIIDTKNAATVIPGEFFATGHDYRADLAEFVRAAFGFEDVSEEQMERIEARLRRSEMERAERIAQG